MPAILIESDAVEALLPRRAPDAYPIASQSAGLFKLASLKPVLRTIPCLKGPKNEARIIALAATRHVHCFDDGLGAILDALFYHKGVDARFESRPEAMIVTLDELHAAKSHVEALVAAGAPPVLVVIDWSTAA